MMILVSKRKVWDITDIAQDLGQEYCEALLGLHVFTGEDTNCAFKGKGKITPLKKMQSKPGYQSALRKLGRSWELEPSVIKELERFTCFLYGYGRVSSVNDVRTAMLKKMVGEGQQINCNSKVDLSRLPPCYNSLVPHILRVNYRLAQWKRSHENMPEIPNPKDHGWSVTAEGRVEPLWSDGPILPDRLIDLLDGDTEEEEEDVIEGTVLDMVSSDDEDYDDDD